MSKSTTELTATYARTTDLTDDERYRLLASERRRSVLDALADRSVPLDLDDLAAAVAAREGSLEAGDAEGMNRLKAKLHHVDLPLMDEVGVLDYDPIVHRIDP